MAKGQMRSNREKKKPKANKPKGRRAGGVAICVERAQGKARPRQRPEEITVGVVSQRPQPR